MEFLIAVAATYVILAFIRAIYRLAVGFFYSPPKAVSKMIRHYRPLVSVIVPAWNEEVGITHTVRSVLQSSYKNIEIIVVDDGSTDYTASRVESIAKRSKRVRLISQKNGGKSEALNKGIAACNGELVLTLDADSYLDSKSIQKMVNTLSDKKYGVAIGEVVVGNTKNWIGRAQHYEYTVGFHVKRSQHVFDSAYIFPGALTMFRKQVLDSVGSFTHYSSTEDLDISMRIKMAGYKIAYVDSALCITEGATSVRGLLNQRTRWRHGYLECLRHHRNFMFSRKKGMYLTLVDLPMQLIGVLELFLLPFILAMLGYLLIVNTNPFSLLIAYLIVPFVLIMLCDLRKKHSQISQWILIAPIMLMFLEFIEYIALLKATYRTVRRRKTTWTVWKRSGASA